MELREKLSKLLCLILFHESNLPRGCRWNFQAICEKPFNSEDSKSWIIDTYDSISNLCVEQFGEVQSSIFSLLILVEKNKSNNIQQ